MNIVEKDGDILAEKLDIIIQQINIHNRFGGLAGKIVKTYPEVGVAAKDAEDKGKNVLGQVSPAYSKNHDVYIFSIYAQTLDDADPNFPGRRTNYEALYTSLCKCSTFIKKVHSLRNAVVKVGIPKRLGCDLGGGDWNIVYAMFKSIFDAPDLKDIAELNIINFPV